MLKSTCAVVLSIALAVTGINGAKSKRRKNKGWIMYESLSVMSYLGRKEMTIQEMCRL